MFTLFAEAYQIFVCSQGSIFTTLDYYFAWDIETYEEYYYAEM